MTHQRPKVFYFRSLSTSGNDLIKIGPFHIGSFSSRFEREFKAVELDFIPVLGMGGGPLLEQAERAKEFLKAYMDFEKSISPVHFFGHSAGGLVAKLIAKDPLFQRNLKSIVTIGTPHKGSSAAKWALGIPKSNPVIFLLCKIFKYDIASKSPTFESFHLISNQSFDFPSGVLTGSIICAPPKRSWSLLARIVHWFSWFTEVNEPSDGLVEEDAQYFGNYQWRFNLDHIQQVGFGGQKREFKRLCRHLEKIWLELL